ncbi:hypothetical protein K504DRAFT_352932, partial [Pleomassaria siparia CBS 279.74]
IARACIFILLSRLTHQLVRCFDSVYDATSRRSRTEFEAVPWGRLAVGAVLLVSWHVWLARLSHVAIVEARVRGEAERGGRGGQVLESRADEEKSVSWGRILGRVLVPLFLACSGVVWSVKLTARLLLLFNGVIPTREKGLKEGMS